MDSESESPVAHVAAQLQITACDDLTKAGRDGPLRTVVDVQQRRHRSFDRGVAPATKPSNVTAAAYPKRRRSTRRCRVKRPVDDCPRQPVRPCRHTPGLLFDGRSMIGGNLPPPVVKRPRSCVAFGNVERSTSTCSDISDLSGLDCRTVLDGSRIVFEHFGGLYYDLMGFVAFHNLGLARYLAVAACIGVFLGERSVKAGDVAGTF